MKELTREEELEIILRQMCMVCGHIRRYHVLAISMDYRCTECDCKGFREYD